MFLQCQNETLFTSNHSPNPHPQEVSVSVAQTQYDASVGREKKHLCDYKRKEFNLFSAKVAGRTKLCNSQVHM